MGRSIDSEVSNRILEQRRAAGLSQAELARRTGLTRQAISAIEAGQYVPNTAVALRLARALNCPVEELFRLPNEPARIDAELIGVRPTGSTIRVQLARVGERTLARPLTGPAGSAAADGLIAPEIDTAGPRVPVDLLIEPKQVENTVVVVGCDPSLALLGAHLSRRYPSLRLHWVQAGSRAALRALARGEAHLAGSHLHDPETDEDNLPDVRRELTDRRLLIVTLSHWQQGLIVARGNPKAIHEPADLGRPDVAIVNREMGSGSRALLDHHLHRSGVATEQVLGYDRELASHHSVAEFVASGAADAGPGILAAARAFDLDFIPLQTERYDLVIPLEYLHMPAVQGLLDVAVSPLCRAEVEALGGYDSSRAGSVVAEL